MFSYRKALVGAVLIGATAAGGALAATAFTASSTPAAVSAADPAATPAVDDTSTTPAADTSGTTDSTTDSSTDPATDNDGDGPHGPHGRGGPHDPSQGGHVANGITETLLTGDIATKVTAAAQTAVPDGTIERVETDAEGAAYEAHMEKADGSHVTVKVNSDFTVKSIDTGH